MTMQTAERSPASILNQIDVTLNELLALRQKVQAMEESAMGAKSLATQLYGSLGQGSWDEIESVINISTGRRDRCDQV